MTRIIFAPYYAESSFGLAVVGQPRKKILNPRLPSANRAKPAYRQSKRTYEVPPKKSRRGNAG